MFKIGGWLDPVDGPIGLIAYTISAVFQWPIDWFLRFVNSDNLDNVPYSLLRILVGWLVIVCVFCAILSIWIGWWSFLVANFAIIILCTLAYIHH